MLRTKFLSQNLIILKTKILFSIIVTIHKKYLENNADNDKELVFI
jgi:hypothetical protein